MGRIVVGTDGSGPALRALRTAIDLAASTGDRIEVVYVYPPLPNRDGGELFGYSSRAPIIGAGGLHPQYSGEQRERHEELRAAARRKGRSRVSQIIEHASEGRPGVRISASVECDSKPARTLIRYANDAKMLVVGFRGHGGFAGPLLGSVSQQCAQHGKCPVLIAR